jgi:hypothetical protein
MGYDVLIKIYLNNMEDNRDISCEKICDNVCRCVVNFFVYFKFISIEAVDDINQQKNSLKSYNDRIYIIN